jgi:hypothetical protein
MGKYIQVPENQGKAVQIVELYGGEIVDKPAQFADIPAGKALVVVVSNGSFDAAGWAFDEIEFEEFTDPSDLRPHQYVMMDEAKVRELTG